MHNIYYWIIKAADNEAANLVYASRIAPEILRNVSYFCWLLSTTVETKILWTEIY